MDGHNDELRDHMKDMLRDNMKYMARRAYWGSRNSNDSWHLPSRRIRRIRRTPSLTRLITFTTIDELMWRLTND